MLQFLLYRLAQGVVTHLPLSVSYWLADRIADLHFLFSVRSRRQVLKNLRWIHDGKQFHALRDARKVFQNFGETLADFFCLSKIGREEFFKRVEVVGIEHVQNALKKGKGVVVVTAHLGNWEWGGVGLSFLGYPVHALAWSHQNRWVNQFFVNQRTRKGVHVLSLNGSIWQSLECLNKNEILLLVSDRLFSNNGIPVTFLGRKVSLPRGPAALSRRCGSPVVVGFMIRNRRKHFTLVFEEPIEAVRTNDSTSDVQGMTQKMASLLESTIRRYPTQWFLFQGLQELS